MREALFIKKNRDKWQRYQRENITEPDEQADRFITLLDDLAYSQTYYPQSKVTRWINGIAVSIYQGIYQNYREKSSRFIDFWTKEMPTLYWRYRYPLYFSFAFFALSFMIGYLSSSKDALFIKAILGEDYVATTQENFSKNDPFGIYRDEDKFTMFVYIAFNNIRVAFMCFACGLSAGLGTLYLLLHNGVMVGTFEQMFFRQGIGAQSLLVVWIHGTIEIASIIVAGAAGLVMGGGMLFPGTQSRFQSFIQGAKNGFKMLLSLIPFFVLAALLESYVTYLMSNRFSKVKGVTLPLWAGILILVVSMAIIIFYFLWLPWHRNREAVRKKSDNHPIILWQQ